VNVAAAAAAAKSSVATAVSGADGMASLQKFVAAQRQQRCTFIFF
jgi:hypothetical protein